MSTGKENYIKKKEFNKKLRTLIKNISGCENSIESLEEELTELSTRFESPDQAPYDQDQGNNTLFIKYGELKKTLEKKMDEWEKLHSEFEDLKKSSYYLL